jgi:Holin of 3TMs, for gene-transfer release
MNPLLITAILDIGKSVIGKFFPDPAQAAAAQLELLRLQQAGEFKQLEADLQLALAQIQTNQLEAQSGSLFRGGWRPFIGWVCGCGLAYQLLLRPLLQMVVDMYATKTVLLVTLEMETLTTLLFGMLGLGAMRTYEKLKDKA